MRYYILEKIEKDSIKMRVIPCNNIGELFKKWLENPANRIMVKEIEVEIIEKMGEKNKRLY